MPARSCSPPPACSPPRSSPAACSPPRLPWPLPAASRLDGRLRHRQRHPPALLADGRRQAGAGAGARIVRRRAVLDQPGQGADRPLRRHHVRRPWARPVRSADGSRPGRRPGRGSRRPDRGAQARQAGADGPLDGQRLGGLVRGQVSRRAACGDPRGPGAGAAGHPRRAPPERPPSPSTSGARRS